MNQKLINLVKEFFCAYFHTLLLKKDTILHTRQNPWQPCKLLLFSRKQIIVNNTERYTDD